MIDAPIMMGMQGFVWFFGFVEGLDDPKKLGRAQVRVVGTSTTVKTSDLFWARIAVPAQSPSHNGIGQSPNGLLVGSMVMGFFMDSEHQQQPMILFSWWGMDLSGFVTGDKKISKGSSTFEPASPAKPTYPHNKVFTTESGHVIEYDDTPGAERLHFFHKSGTYDEVGPDGTRVVKNVGDTYEIDLGKKKMYVKSDLTVQVDGNVNMNVKGTTVINGAGNITVTAPVITLNG
jgi:hypothetical protein